MILAPVELLMSLGAVSLHHHRYPHHHRRVITIRAVPGTMDLMNIMMMAMGMTTMIIPGQTEVTVRHHPGVIHEHHLHLLHAGVSMTNIMMTLMIIMNALDQDRSHDHAPDQNHNHENTPENTHHHSVHERHPNNRLDGLPNREGSIMH
jgi:hypothetical protein